ncbi:carboxylesterase BioH (pimeloyl-CoA synthesis) [Modicisalibacter xianhensis]|uniref:Carboxylesterase BioH (Pimeloyl-CoA synthesis) n=1 Tax=Modicisalibacter xianhensis TaxID=442341 RepID=A0A4R8FH65_9GAMM|nr:alpha/beta fold hydrolase [Halomonas xianhensis]TDX22975.1 carboxylesterase BioH (pimeloyl-CoA synthesis) [Halomonas xianhensis]
MSRLVLLSGWGINASIWHPLQAYWPAELHVVAPDWPGYGAFPPLEVPSDLDALAEAMATKLSTDAVWVGWSLGGLLAAELLKRLPAPRGLVMLGMRPSFTVDDATRGGVTVQDLAAFRHAFSHDPQRTWQHFLHLQLRGEPSPRQALQRLTSLLDDSMPANTTTLAAGLEQLANLNVCQALQKSPCTTYFVRGEQDPLLPELANENSILLPGCGHCPQLSVPHELARCLSDLAQSLTDVTACQVERHDAR